MKTTGFAMREALSAHKMTKEALIARFKRSLKAFKNEDKPKPQEVMRLFCELKAKVAKLQVAQARFNLVVTVYVESLGDIPLCEAIKRVGGAGRVAKIWNAAVTAESGRYYGCDDDRTRP